MKLKSIKISGLDNREALDFFVKIIHSLNEVNTELFQEVYDKFKIAIEKLADALDAYSIFALSEDIKIQQLNLNHIFSLMLQAIDLNCHATDPHLKRLGFKSNAIVNYFSEVHTGGTGIFEKKDPISNIIDAMEDLMTERERREIGISTYLKSLKKQNIQLLRMHARKATMESPKASTEIYSIRKMANKVYRELVSEINTVHMDFPYDMNLVQIMTYLDDLGNIQQCISTAKEHTATTTKTDTKGSVVA